MLSTTTKALILGDVHGDDQFLDAAVSIAMDNGCDALIQVGDFGYYPRSEEYKAILKDYPMPVYFIDGNHEDFYSIGKLPQTDLAEVRKNLYYIRRGSAFKIRNTQTLFLGGAWTIDGSEHTEGLDLFTKEEVISLDNEVRAINQPRADLVITHDSPLAVNISGDTYTQSMRNRESLDRVLEKHTPKYWYFGHWHRKYQAQLGRTVFSCLDCNFHWPVPAVIFDFEAGEEVERVLIGYDWREV